MIGDMFESATQASLDKTSRRSQIGALKIIVGTVVVGLAVLLIACL